MNRRTYQSPRKKDENRAIFLREELSLLLIWWGNAIWQLMPYPSAQKSKEELKSPRKTFAFFPIFPQKRMQIIIKLFLSQRTGVSNLSVECIQCVESQPI